MEPRTARIQRATGETRISVELNLDGSGESRIATGVPFFDHMLAQVARHGHFDLTVNAEGDLEVDAHHTVEDVGIALGQALRQALGGAAGIVRYASMEAPMDDALVAAAVDISGRPFLHFNVPVGREMLGTFPADLAVEFFRAFTVHAGVTLHVSLRHGQNIHHIVEAAFKALALVLDRATRQDDRVRGVPSTKGVL